MSDFSPLRCEASLLMRHLALLVAISLIAHGCAKRPDVAPLAASRSYPLTSFLVDYQTWSCRDLTEEAALLNDALAVASEPRTNSTTEHLKARAEGVERVRTAKKCRPGRSS